MTATLSILGLYTYDPTIFDNFHLPAGVDKDTLTDNLLCELAEFEVLYPNADFLKALIGAWSRKELPVWEKLLATTMFEYDPISNYDRTEEWSETRTGRAKTTGTSSATDTADVASKVAGFNSEELVNRDASTSNATSSTQDEVNNENSDDTIKTGRAYGNIGVTTTQQMIEAERAVVAFNIYDYIINSFRSRFCLLIY